MELTDFERDYGILCAKLGDLVIRGEINDRQMEETKEKLHKLQVKAKKHFETKPAVVPEDKPVETLEQ